MISEQECMTYNEKIKNIIKCYLLIHLHVAIASLSVYRYFNINRFLSWQLHVTMYNLQVKQTLIYMTLT